MVGSLFASKAPQTFTQATLVKTLVSEKQDKKILKEQLITTLHDVSLLEPNDWKNLKLSPATEQALKNALAQLNSNPTAFGPNTAVSDVISDKKDLEKLAKQLIFNLQDIAWMSDADWKEVNISAASQAKLAESASKISGSSASSNTSEDAPLSKIVTDKADLEKLDKEWLFTLSDIKRLEDKHWKQLSLSAASEAALKATVSASPAKGGNSSLSSIISNKADLATLDKEWIFTLEDVKKLTTADWKQLSLSSESETKLKAAVGSSGASGASGASDDAKVSSIISDSQDLATLEREWIFTLADVKRLSPSDWQQLRLSSASESKLKAAAGGKSSGGASDDTKVSSIISDSKDLATLEREWIFTLADVKRLSPSDWQQLRLSSASESKLKAAAGGKSSGGASDDTKVSKIVSDPKDLATLEREWIFTLADVKRLSPSDWQQLRLSQNTESLLRSAIGHGQSAAASSTLVKDLITNPKDLKKLQKEWIFTLQDVARLRKEDWKILGLSPESKAILKGKAGKGKGKGKKAKKVKKVKKAFKTSKLAKKSAKLVGKGDRRAKLLKQRVKQLDKAIVIAHKLALKAEIKALKAADNIYKLERRKKQLKKAAKAKAKKVAF